MKNWSLARIMFIAIAYVLLVCALGILWLFWRAANEPAIGDDVYIMVDPQWTYAFFIAMLLPPVALLISWIVLRWRG